MDTHIYFNLFLLSFREFPDEEPIGAGIIGRTIEVILSFLFFSFKFYFLMLNQTMKAH